MKVKELMNEAYVIDKDMPIASAARLMTEKSIGSLLFVEGRKIKGIITERDLLKNFNKGVKVSQIMSKSIITAPSSITLQEALEVMNDHKIKKLPLVDDGELVGIITATDLLANLKEIDGDFFFE
jgi:IMP dehydrogenase